MTQDEAQAKLNAMKDDIEACLRAGAILDDLAFTLKHTDTEGETDIKPIQMWLDISDYGIGIEVFTHESPDGSALGLGSVYVDYQDVAYMTEEGEEVMPSAQVTVYTARRPCNDFLYPPTTTILARGTDFDITTVDELRALHGQQLYLAE